MRGKFCGSGSISNPAISLDVQNTQQSSKIIHPKKRRVTSSWCQDTLVIDYPLRKMSKGNNNKHNSEEKIHEVQEKG